MSKCLNFFILCILLSIFVPSARPDEAKALLKLKSSLDSFDVLQWRGNDVCKWQGIKECMNGSVTKLVLEHVNLTGALEERTLSQLNELRVLSFKGNSLSGQIPDLSALTNLKSLFLNDNNFSGHFPDSICLLHRLKVVVLSGNQISGRIPEPILWIRRLYVLYLQDNRLTGEIPPLNQTRLRFFNVSNNRLSGEIPITPVLARFNASSFSGNVDLCGEQIQNPCNGSHLRPPINPAFPILPKLETKHHRKPWKLIKILAGSIGGFLILCLVVVLLILCLRKKQTSSVSTEVKPKVAGGGDEGGEERGDMNSGVGGVEKFSWEGEGLGNLVFCLPEEKGMRFGLEDLLKASAETMGRGSVGSTYKAVMESGFIVTVKRLKDARYPPVAEFRQRVEELGRLRHPNLVPLRAYFQAKEERLLVYDYFPNGSLFSLIHGSRGSASGKPLHWTSCLKISEDLATGLHYIHQSHGLIHGNLKSSNVLLGSDFESCLTDHGLTAFRNPDYSPAEDPSASPLLHLFYRAPECRDCRNLLTQQADVYSFGVLLLELLTGKTPFRDFVQEHGTGIPSWVRSVREEEMDSGDDPASSGNEASEEKLGALVNIAMACVSIAPDKRPGMRDVLRMIREARAEAQGSSHSSDHSHGSWSGTVQTLTREEDHLNM